MGFLSKLGNNLFNLAKQPFHHPMSQAANSEMGYFGMDRRSETGKEGVYAKWFFNATFGEPHRKRVDELRTFAKSSWAQMPINTFKRQIFTTEWDIVPIDEDDETDYSGPIAEAKEFLNDLNSNHQTIDDLNSEAIQDIAVLDMGVWNKVYSGDSYEIGDIPIYDNNGQITGTREGLILKPLGERRLVKIKSLDGGTILKQMDVYKNIRQYWQYSYKHPIINPTPFDLDEISFMVLNKQPDTVYGFSPIESIQQVLQLMIEATRYNKEMYEHNAIPDVIVSLAKLPKDELEKLKRSWYQKYKRRPHRVGWINWPIEAFHKLVDSNRDLEWLQGMQWYFKIPFGIFGVSPTECGYFENSNRSNDEGQERVTVRNAMKPHYKLLENTITNEILPEIWQKKLPLRFKFMPKDQVREKIEFDQDIKKLELGVMTINEFRRKSGKKEVDWGDEPLRRPFNPENSFMNFVSPNDRDNSSADDNPDDGRQETNPSQDMSDKSNLSKEIQIDAGEEIVSQAEDYSDFLLRTFDNFERRILSAMDKLQLEKSQNIDKTMGDFLQGMFNVVNTAIFVKRVKKYIKADLMAGLVSAESELGLDIGYTESYKNKLTQVYQQQIDGYTINGKKWPGIKGVTKEVQHKVIKTVQNGIQKNMKLDDIKKDVKDVFEGFSDWRSEMIARTESTRITNEGKVLGYKESGLKGKKIWKAAIDARTSPICRRLNGQITELDDDFFDQDTMKSYRTPPAHPNCRSTIAFRPD